MRLVFLLHVVPVGLVLSRTFACPGQVVPVRQTVEFVLANLELQPERFQKCNHFSFAE